MSTLGRLAELESDVTEPERSLPADLDEDDTPGVVGRVRDNTDDVLRTAAPNRERILLGGVLVDIVIRNE